MQCFKVFAKNASDVSGLICADRILFQMTGPLYFKEHFPRFVFTFGIYSWSVCRVPYPCIFLPYWKISGSKLGTLLFYHRYINFPNKYLLISPILKKPSSLNNGPVWSRYFEKVISRTIRFCKTTNGYKLVSYALPQTWLQYVKKGYTIEKYKLLRASIYRTFLAFNNMHIPRDTLPDIYAICFSQFNKLSI